MSSGDSLHGSGCPENLPDGDREREYRDCPICGDPSKQVPDHIRREHSYE